MIEPGMTLDGRYKLFKTLGEGGMANVYLAHDLILDRDVAVKVLRLDLQSDPDAARRFRREAMATLELSHPNIVSIYDVGEFEGQQYLVMEYVDGKNLKQYIVEHFPIPYAKVVAMMTQVLGAIETAHEHNIIHRDLKPQNIMVDRDGNVKIADFGIAVALSETAVTQTNSLLGSVHYMSPEQARGSLPTKQSDIYSLGVILYEMLTGSVPFEGDSAVTIALKHFQEDIPYVRDFDPRIPQALENVVLKSTAKDPQQRYPSAAAMASDLATSLDASRANEPRFIPEGSSDSMAATKRIDPAVKAATIAAAASALGKDGQDVKADADKDAKKQPGKKAHPKRKRALIIGGLAMVLILLITGMVAVFGKGDVTVPDVTGDTVAVATTKLKSAHLKVGDTTYKSSGSVTKDHIILTDPTKGDSVKENSAVNLVISKGKSKYTLKNYVGDTYSDVSADLKAAGFTVKKKTRTSTEPSGTILKQDLAAGTKVTPSKTTITLTVSKKKSSSTVSVPDFTGQPVAVASAWADDHGMMISETHADSDSIDSGNIISQGLTPGERVKRGTTLTIVISNGSGTSSVNNGANTDNHSSSSSSSESSSSSSSSSAKPSTTPSTPVESSTSSVSSSSSSDATPKN